MKSEFPFDELDGWRHGDCAFSIDTLGLRVSSQQQAAPFNKPDLHDKQHTFPLQERYAHELDHLFRSVGTSWGLLCHVMLGRVLHYYLRVVSEYDFAVDLGEYGFAKFVQDIRRSGTSCRLLQNGKPVPVGVYNRGDWWACYLGRCNRG